MLLKSFLLCCAVSSVYGQAEQAIFAQLYYPPVHVQQARPRVSSTSPPLEVLPLERSGRSASNIQYGVELNNKQTENNDAMFRGLRELMKDPIRVLEDQAPEQLHQ